jgi:hypothetical protein
MIACVLAAPNEPACGQAADDAGSAVIVIRSMIFFAGDTRQTSRADAEVDDAVGHQLERRPAGMILRSLIAIAIALI